MPKFCSLGKGIGPRIYFSFSSAINGRTPDKLRARIAAVPDDRLLLESDQVGGRSTEGQGGGGKCGSILNPYCYP